MVDAVVVHQSEDLPYLKRILHTIKGNAGLFGMSSVSALYHSLENKIIKEGVTPDDHKLATLQEEWNGVRSNLGDLLGDKMDRGIEINDDDYEAVLRALLNKESPDKITKMIQSWKLETTKHRLDFIKQQTENLAQRMGKRDLKIKTKPSNLRLENEHWAAFWFSFVHVLRNAIDHGIETEEERIRSGKTGHGSIQIETYIENNEFVIALEDDGRGINWEAIEATASILPTKIRKISLKPYL